MRSSRGSTRDCHRYRGHPSDHGRRLDLRAAASYLGKSRDERTGEGDDPTVEGDVVRLAAALSSRIASPAVVTDDKPLRKTCKAVSVPVSSTIGVLIRAVEQGAVDRGATIEKLYAMDEVGARLSASLIRRAERLIDEGARE